MQYSQVVAGQVHGGSVKAEGLYLSKRAKTGGGELDFRMACAYTRFTRLDGSHLFLQ